MYITIKNEKTGVDELFPDATPIRYSENGTKLGYCFNDYENTMGQILSSGSVMLNQQSCRANTGNGGNWYTYKTSISSSDSKNSICPYNWKLPTYPAYDTKSYYALIRTFYNISENKDTYILNQPFSFIRSGEYNVSSKSPEGRNYQEAYLENNGNFLYGHSTLLDPQRSDGQAYGFSLRCNNQPSPPKNPNVAKYILHRLSESLSETSYALPSHSTPVEN